MMKLKSRDFVGARLASGMGVGLIALSLSAGALAQGEKTAAPPPQAKTAEPKAAPQAKAPAPGLKQASQPATLRGTPTPTQKDTGKKDRGAAPSKETESSAEGEEAEKKPAEPTRKEKEARGAARVQREVALRRYATAKEAVAEADAEIGPDSKVDQVEARAARKAALAELKNARKGLHSAHRYDSKPFVGMKAAEKKVIDTKLKAHLAELRKTRKERTEESRLALEKRYGKKLGLKTVQEERVIHSWRVARLNQIIEVAMVTDRPEEAERARELLKKEDAASKKKLAKLSLAPLPPSSPEAGKKPEMASKPTTSTKTPSSSLPAAPKGAAQ
jgi:hypothetical protein